MYILKSQVSTIITYSLRLFLQRHNYMKFLFDKPKSLLVLILVVCVRGQYDSKAAASLKSPPYVGASSEKVAFPEICLTHRQLDRLGACPSHNSWMRESLL